MQMHTDTASVVFDRTGHSWNMLYRQSRGVASNCFINFIRTMMQSATQTIFLQLSQGSHFSSKMEFPDFPDF